MRYIQTEINHNGFTAQLSAYLLSSSPEIGIAKRPLVVLLPGGGYGMTSDREAEPVAMELLAMGIHVCLLRYSVAPARFPVALAQVAKVIVLARQNEDDWQIDARKICVMGFSAGGHLAASIGVFWKDTFVREETKLNSDQIKPNGLLLCYPVITSGEKGHSGSFQNLLGADADDNDKLDFVSLEKRVSSHTPPTFLWHTYEDKGVPVENTMLFMDALRKHGVVFESHIFPNGPHGLSLGTRLTDSANDPGSFTNTPEVSIWIDMAARWVLNLPDPA